MRRTGAGAGGCRRTHTAGVLGIVAVTLLGGLLGCSAVSGGTGATATTTATATDTSAAPSAAASTAPAGSITVFAASSLKSTFSELGAEFEAANPGTTVSFSFAGSADLVTQLTGGAPADVFASADTKNMAKLTGAGLVGDAPVDFATNVLEIAVPPGNPAAVTSFADLGRPEVVTVICAPAVPCGSATAAVETATGITIPAVSEESSVTDVLGKVSSGEADAGLVYVTDVKGAGTAVTGIPFPESSSAVNTYPIATLSSSKSAALAQAFIRFVTSSTGKGVLKAAGFGAP